MGKLNKLTTGESNIIKKWCSCLDIFWYTFTFQSRTNWFGHVNRVDSKRNVSQAFNSNPQGSRLRGEQKTSCGNV